MEILFKIVAFVAIYPIIVAVDFWSMYWAHKDKNSRF